MVQPGKGELLSSPCSARDSMECMGDTGCSVQQEVDSLGVETLSGSVLLRWDKGVFWTCLGQTLRHYSYDWCRYRSGGSSWLPGDCCVGCGDVQLLDLLSYLLGWGVIKGTTCFFFIREPYCDAWGSFP
ncbi:hypothetical protein L1987_15939 [Smallanthus sonchifolius]|uniref:Uncharacterized protein n=1 Tax=Smallanthus sonchifolius TaxID=185202 RepID=A0ACB9J7Y3_9ASTR|nr:hypothetical protein L1987_15939 [Smallanthus sonchifolius]